eukprot:gnl/TRDRNA2_/TRDRNA2_165459_c0_seq1.p1 gnl/TRDRNA2_/TRDRNA2_165459_c0~~gnl/TRDRNA2_/TRDRNA2_165459_c0_seq1.p1  ORF type:complete len:238 (+),score=25.54 gnl/TRDRNA2_/TRDRNA2_165459_c0_seq1:36-716(+)
MSSFVISYCLLSHVTHTTIQRPSTVALVALPCVWGCPSRLPRMRVAGTMARGVRAHPLVGIRAAVEGPSEEVPDKGRPPEKGPGQERPGADWRSQEPAPELKAVEVVAIQLRALQENDPQTDDGIAKTFEFASPQNRASTGPLPRFAAMIYQGYPALVNSKDFTILSAIPIGENVYLVRIEVLVKDQTEPLRYVWQLSNDGSGWRTDAVGSARWGEAEDEPDADIS